jgi:SM-20-related protein
MSWYSEEKWVEWIDQLSNDDFLVIDEFLPEELYNLIKQFFTRCMEEDGFVKAGLGSLFNNQVVDSIRGDYTFWLDRERDEKMAPFFSLIDELIAQMNRLCYLSLSGYEFHFSHYPAGTFYKKHLDQFKDKSNRMISLVMYFNEDWKQGDGGELKIFREDGREVLVAPLARRCVIFKSATIEHEVLPTRLSRFSLTGWLLYKPSGVGYLLT